MEKETFTIVIPCLNEKDTIQQVVKDSFQALKRYGSENSEIIIADNGSTDGSLKLLKKWRKLKVIHVPIRGYGATLHYGILSSSTKYILFADADLSYDLLEIYKFLPPIHKQYDLILGSRFLGTIENGAMPLLHKLIGTPFLTFLIKIIYKINTTDCNSGMRAIKKSFYQRLHMKDSGMEWASELLIKTSIYHGKYIEVPIRFKKDKRKQKPHLKSWEDGWRHLKVIILLKPKILIIFAIAIIGIGIFSLSYSFFTAIAMILFAEFWVLSYLTLEALRAAIHREPNRISNFINNIPLVLASSLLTIVGIAQLFLISDRHLFTKYIILFQVVIVDLWVFFIETIKTHLINPLSNKL